MKKGYVYLLASRRNGTLYIGVTSYLVGRVWEHKEKIHEGFSKKHDVIKLVWYEEFDDITEAIYQEKKMKKWKREWKIELIEKTNPQWKDLYNDLI